MKATTILLFQLLPLIVQSLIVNESTVFYGAFRDLATGCVSEVLPVVVSAVCAVIITGLVVTPVSCLGAGDGSIVITAEGTGQQLAYSITGGQSFNLTGEFHYLSPGTFDILVLVLGDPTCSVSATAIVNPGPAPTTWYKDLDNDGYTDGVTQVSCPQPEGFKASATPGDCNDYDPLKFPGQTWYKDSDNDSWSDGTTLVQCNRPESYKAASELTGTSGDCNDSNAAVNPGATEICNGIDDDCDGQIDEGTTGNQTFVGNVTFTTQAQVNAFSQCYNKIQGILTIQGTGINSLANLGNLIEVTSNVTIKYTGLPNMTGLNALATTGGSLTIQYNNFGAHLTSLDGLEALISVGANLVITTNVYLSDCCSIEALLANAGVGGSILISGNAFGCKSVAQINTVCGNSSLIAPPNTGYTVAQNLDKAKSMTLSPNPATEIVNVEISGEYQSGRLRVFDCTGRLILENEMEESIRLLTLDVSNWQPGVYLVQVLLDEEQFSERLIVE